MVYEGREHRKERRFELNLSVLIKRPMPEEETFTEVISKNISRGGLYFTASEWDIEPQEEVIVSVSVPKEKTKIFPFSRLAGRAKVVRVEQFGQQRWQGVALQFSDDLTYLAAVSGY